MELIYNSAHRFFFGAPLWWTDKTASSTGEIITTAFYAGPSVSFASNS